MLFCSVLFKTFHNSIYPRNKSIKLQNQYEPLNENEKKFIITVLYLKYQFFPFIKHCIVIQNMIKTN